MVRTSSTAALFRSGGRDERGQALILSLVTLMALIISAATVIVVVTSNQSQSTGQRQGAAALSAADAGLDLAANAVSTVGTQTSLSGSSTVDSNAVTWSAAKTTPATGAAYWTLNATAVSPNGKVTRVLQEQMQLTSSPTSNYIPPIYGYGFVMGGAPNPTQYTTNTQVDAYCASGGAVTVFGGSGAITVPAWINGDFCASGGSDPAIGNLSSSNPIAVHIGGTMYDQQGPTCVIGAPAGICGNQGAVASVKILGGCWNHHVAAKVPCDSNSQTAVNGGSGVYATSFTPTDPIPTPSKPIFDSATEQSLYNSASPGPKNACGAGSSGSPPANLFDSNTTLDGSLGATDFATHMGAGTWVCKTSSGELDWSWNGVRGSVATLGLQGVVFFDGSFTLNANDLIKFAQNSRGSIYIDGTMTMTNNASMCSAISGGACDFSAAWDPKDVASDPLIFFAAYNRQGASFGWSMSGASGFQGILYTNGGYSLGNGTTMMGSVFADYASVIGDGEFQVTNTPPFGALGITTTSATTTFAVAPRTWRQCPAARGCS
jgi:hypothetical protein